MSNVDNILILIGIYGISYLLFDKLVFRLTGSLRTLGKMQLMLRLATLVALGGLIYYAMLQAQAGAIPQETLYWNTAQHIGLVALGWAGLEFLLSLIAPFTTNRPRHAESE